VCIYYKRSTLPTVWHQWDQGVFNYQICQTIMHIFKTPTFFVSVSVTSFFYTPLLALASSFAFDAIIKMQWIQILKIQVTNSPENTSTSDYDNRKWGTGIMWDHDKSNLILAAIILSGWQRFKSLSAKAYSTALAKKRTTLFWVITQHVVVISYWCLCCITTQKSAALIYFKAAAWNHAQHSPSFMLDYKEGQILRFWPTDVLPYIRVKMYCRKLIFHNCMWVPL